MDVIYRFDPYEALVARQLETPDEAIELLRAGHRQFGELYRRIQAVSLGHEPAGDAMVIPCSPLTRGMSLVHGAAPPQKPFAIILSCSDSRVPIEELFQVSANSVFVVRVAGNTIGTEILGSISYAVNNFRDSIRLVVVLGHSACGAVTAAVDSFLRPDQAGDIIANYPLRSLVDRLLLSVRMASRAQSAGETPVDHSGRATLIESASYVNAALTAFELRQQLGLVNDDRVRMMYGVYDLRTTRVRSLPSLPAGSDVEDFLAEAPHDSASLLNLASRIGDVYKDVRGLRSISDLSFVNWNPGDSQ